MLGDVFRSVMGLGSMGASYAGGGVAARLITIPFSHYCEKARWALDRCGIAYREDGHLPIFHYLATARAGGGRTVPVVVTGATVLTDSTNIVAWADGHKPATLIPADPVERDQALALEDDFDRALGPATRRWTYFHLLPRRDLDDRLLVGVPRWERVALRVARPLATRMLTRRLAIDAASVERSRAEIDASFAAVDRLLADGRRYLVGGRFSVADLAFASLAAPAVLPPTHPATMPALDDFSPAPRAAMQHWRATAAGQHALRMYARERT